MAFTSWLALVEFQGALFLNCKEKRQMVRVYEAGKATRQWFRAF